jgi:hypothetical protein
MPQNRDKVTISKEHYKQLLEADAILNALHYGGVDNWEGYEDSMAHAREED